jgi:putative Mg2+ transporter-C (MgtC) family protein
MKVYLISQVIPLLQLVAAAGLGMLLGMERSLAGKTAGMRTYGLVSMGACLFVVVSIAVAESFASFTNVDPLRILEAVITGVGFIGAGIILFQESTLKGLTTAAGLWISAGIGITVGYGLYILAICATLLALFIFTAMWYLEQRIRTSLGREEIDSQQR